jgi:hypothetical protein
MVFPPSELDDKEIKSEHNISRKFVPGPFGKEVGPRVSGIEEKGEAPVDPMKQTLGFGPVGM